MAPEPPDDYVQRPKEYDTLKDLLLKPTGTAGGAIAALRGAGGYGKTTLAKKLAHDPDIANSYPDGVLWVELGEQCGEAKILALVANLIGWIDPSSKRPIGTIDAARTALGEALDDRRFLLVLDDVWQKQHLDAFLRAGKNSSRLVTTRFNFVLPGAATQQPVDAMQSGEAQMLLGAGLPRDQVGKSSTELAMLAKRLGEWPQLLKLVNGFLRNKENVGQTVAEAIALANAYLDEEGLTAFDSADDADRTQAVEKTIGVTLRLLSEPERQRFAELGIFPEDVDVPTSIVERLWREVGGLTHLQTTKVVQKLHSLALLLNLDLGRQTVRLHDTTRRYLRDKAGANGLLDQNRQLVRAMADIRLETKTTSEADYFYRYLPQHLADTNDRPTLDAILFDPSWLRAKLSATNSLLSLVGDYEQHSRGPMQSYIGRTLRLIAGICTRDKRQLLPQLVGRLMTCSDPAALEFITRSHNLIEPPAMVPLRPSLAPPGAEVARLEGHTGPVIALTLLPDGRLASGSFDCTVRLWDVTTGAETACLEGHTLPVSALTVLPDGRLASGSHDNTVRLWDVTTGAEIARLEGRAGWVNALTVVPDGQLASGANDVRLWDVTTGAETVRLKGHTLIVLPDGRLASASHDKTVRLWDVMTGAEIARLEGHTKDICALTVLPDGRLASCSYDKTVRLWDVTTGAEIARLEGHAGFVNALTVVPDGQLASGSNDRTVRLWDVTTGAETVRLKGHTDDVRSLTVLPDGRLASGGWDRTVRLWDLTVSAQTGLAEGHTSSVNALAMLPDGRLASASDDHTVRLWDVTTGAETARLEGHTSGVNALAVLPDGRLASGSYDKTVRLWDVTTGAETSRLEGHTCGIEALTVLPDGRLASGGGSLDDNTVRLWDVMTGAETARLEGHTMNVVALTVLPDGRLASGSYDKTVRLWDVTTGAETAHLGDHTNAVSALTVLSDGRLVLGSHHPTVRLLDVTTGAEIARLEGHTRIIIALTVLPDGRLASGSEDRTVRLWDVTTGTELCRFEIDAPVYSILSLANGTLVIGDWTGRLHWLKIVG